MTTSTIKCTRIPEPSSSALPTRQRLLLAAAPMFAELGYKKTKVRDIAVAAKSHGAAVNYHFGSKAGILNAVNAEAAK